MYALLVPSGLISGRLTHQLVLMFDVISSHLVNTCIPRYSLHNHTHYLSRSVDLVDQISFTSEVQVSTKQSIGIIGGYFNHLFYCVTLCAAPVNYPSKNLVWIRTYFFHFNTVIILHVMIVHHFFIGDQ